MTRRYGPPPTAGRPRRVLRHRTDVRWGGVRSVVHARLAAAGEGGSLMRRGSGSMLLGGWCGRVWILHLREQPSKPSWNSPTHSGTSEAVRLSVSGLSQRRGAGA